MTKTANTAPITTYSFRAECIADIEQFASACKSAGLVINNDKPSSIDEMTPDACFEFQATADIETLRTLLSTVPDGHVMLETLRACALSENSLERDYGIEPRTRSIEGTIRFMRSDSAEQVCVCCPPGGGHIYRRYVEWDAWQTNRAEHFGLGPDVLLSTQATDITDNEGKRVRMTLEVLGDTETQSASHEVTPELRRNTLLSVLQKLNSNPYNLTKAECIEVVREMLNEGISA